MDLTELSDRLEISELLARYAVAVDSGDWDLFRSLFTEDAELDYSGAGGVKGTTAVAAAWLADTLSSWPGRLHLLGAATMTFDGDEATVVASYADTLAPSRDMLKFDAPGLIKGGGRYHHRLVRTPDGWRSRGLVLEQIWRTIQ